METKVDRAILQMRAHVGMLKEFINDLGKTGWELGTAEGRVKEVERWEEEGTSSDEVEQLRARVAELEKDRRDLMNNFDNVQEKLRAARMIVDSLRTQVAVDQSKPTTAAAPTSTAAPTTTPPDVRPKEHGAAATFGVFGTPTAVASAPIQGAAAPIPPPRASTTSAATVTNPTQVPLPTPPGAATPPIAPQHPPRAPTPPMVHQRQFPAFQAQGAQYRGGQNVSPAATRIRLIADSKRVISVNVCESNDVVEFVLAMSSLQSSIEEYFGEEDEHTKVLCANAHFVGNVKISGDQVLSMMSDEGLHDLSIFCDRVFKYSFPSYETSLTCGFRKISQQYPTPTTIVGYARRFKVFTDKLEIKLKSHFLKFIEGLSHSDVRNSLLRYPYGTMSFNQLVEYAVGLQNSLSATKMSGVSVNSGREGDQGTASERACGQTSEGGFENDFVYKIMGKSITQYGEAMTRKGLGRMKVCFNCLSQSHLSVNCRSKSCKFCFLTTEKAGHLSILCPKCPSNLTRYVEEREKYNRDYKQKMDEKRAQVRYGNEPEGELTDFNFDQDDVDEE